MCFCECSMLMIHCIQNHIFACRLMSKFWERSFAYHVGFFTTHQAFKQAALPWFRSIANWDQWDARWCIEWKGEERGRSSHHPLFFHVFSLKKTCDDAAIRLCIIICCFVVYANSINGITANPFQSIGWTVNNTKDNRERRRDGGWEGAAEQQLMSTFMRLV